jgi:hypothetical protein
VKFYEALVGGLCGMSERRELFLQVSVNDRAQCCFNSASECASVESTKLRLNGLPYILLCGVPDAVECLRVQFTFSVWRGIVISELPSVAFGSWDFADAAMLIPVSREPHLFTLPGAGKNFRKSDAVETMVSKMVFCGVTEVQEVMQVIVIK